MEEEKNAYKEPVPYLAHEDAIARMERHTFRQWIVILVLIGVLVVTNGAWIVYESQFVDSYTATQTVTQETGEEGGTNTFTGDFYGGDVDGKTDNNKVGH